MTQLLYINTHYCFQTRILSKSTSISHPIWYIQWISISNPFNIHLYVHSSSQKGHPGDVPLKSISYSHVNVPSSSRKEHPMDVHLQSGQDVDVNWIFGPKMDVHRTFCAIWVLVRSNLVLLLDLLILSSRRRLCRLFVRHTGKSWRSG